MQRWTATSDSVPTASVFGPGKAQARLNQAIADARPRRFDADLIE